MSGPTLDSILAAFDTSPEDEGDGWVVTCPAHSDSHRSLKVSVGNNGKVVVKCRAGCETPAVLAAAGLTFRDLSTATATERAPRARGGTATPPPDELAALALYCHRSVQRLQGDTDAAEQARRYVEDRFGIGSDLAQDLGLGLDDGTDDYARLSDEYRRVPRLTVPFYNFRGIIGGLQGRDLVGESRAKWCGISSPEGASWAKLGAFQAGTGHEVTFICEGPSDALTVVAGGFDSVAIRGAALGRNGNVVDALVDALGGRRVILAGDNDAAGQRFTSDLGAALAAAGLVVEALPIPAAYNDVNEWRAAVVADGHAWPATLAAAISDAEALHGGGGGTGTGGTPPTIDPHAPDGFRLTSLGNAHRLREFFGGLIRYSPEIGHFFLWTETGWTEDLLNEVRTAAHAVTERIIEAGQDLIVAAEGDNATEEAGKRLASWGTRSQNTGAINGMIVEAQALAGVAVSVGDLDRHHHLLACRNGVVNLRTGELGPHDPDLLLTRLVDLDYDPDAKCPLWERSISEWMEPHPDVAPWLRRLVGYGITGETSEQVFVVHWGRGANGKSVYLDTLRRTFSGISTTTPYSTFEAKGAGSAPTNDLAALRGARLVMATEGEAAASMSESLLKRATGSDEVTARFLHKEFFSFRPTFLIQLATNFKPRFKGQDEGLWRRVRLVPWERHFGADERDETLQARLMDEAPGILAWAVRGAQEWYSAGLQSPDTVRDATSSFREVSDALAGFYPDGPLSTDPAGTALGSDVYRRYRDWAAEEGLGEREIWSRKALYAALEERGVPRVKRREGITLLGVTLQPPDPALEVQQ